MTSLINSIKINTEEILKNISNKENQYTIPIFIPHLGCKNECVFCNQRKISGKDSNVTLDEVEIEINERLKCFKQKRKIQIAFFGGSFTGLSICQQEEYLKVANKYIQKGIVDSVRISTRPDYISIPILKILRKYNVKTIELGVQSMDDDVLRESKRGHTKLDVIKAARLINLFKFELGFQIMVGLPKSNVQKEINTINELLKFNPKQLRIYPVYVLKESKLYDMYLNKTYKPLELEDAINRVSKVVSECKKSDVQIIRIGLQSTSDITENAKGIIGPISDNFGEYALSKIVLNDIESKIKKINFTKNNNLIILCSKRYISIVIGPRKSNKKYLEEKYSIKIKVIGE